MNLNFRLPKFDPPPLTSSLMSRIHQLISRGLGTLVRCILSRPTAVLLLSVLLTAICIYLAATRFKVINNVAQLLDEKSPANQDYQRLQTEFGTDECYLVLIQSPDPERNRAAADRVANFMQGLHPHIGRVIHRIDFSSVESKMLLLTPPEELRKIETELSTTVKALQKNKVSFHLNQILDEVNRSFDDRYLRDAKNWEAFKPLIENFCKQLDQLADRLEGKAPISSAQSNLLSDRPVKEILCEREYITYQNGKTVLVIGTRGLHEEGEISPFTRTVGKLRIELKKLEVEFPGIHFALTGEPVLSDDELQTSTRDTSWASAITGGLITILFLFAYRNPVRPVFAGIALGVGMAGSFAFAMTAVGHFNIISFAVIPMVLGLGIDFGIQLLSRYEEELSLGRSVDESLITTWETVGVAVVTGGSTTAAAFFTICFNEFLGLRELGLIAGGGIVFSLLANLIVLPALLTIRDRRLTREKLAVQAHTTQWAFLAPVDRLLTHSPRLGLALAGLITLASLYGITHVKFDYNLLHLQNQQLESVQSLHELFRASENSTLFASVIANDITEAHHLESRLSALPSVARVESITALLPLDQSARLPIAQNVVKLARQMKVDPDSTKRVDVPRAQRDITRLLTQSEEALKQASHYTGISSQARMAVEVFGKMIPPLKRAQLAMGKLSSQELDRRLNQSQIEIFGVQRENLLWLQNQKLDREIRLEDLPPALRERFVSPSGKMLLQVYSRKDVWDRAPNAEFVSDVRSIDPHATGTPILNYEYTELLRSSFLHASLWAFVAITLLLLLHFQKPSLVFLALFPLILAVLWRTGLMSLIHLPFNPANIVTLPLIIGIDVAYGVYVMDRFRESGPFPLLSSSTGKAIIMTGLTALFGFASLMVSDYQGMYSIGLLMSLGIVIGMITTLVVLPQCMALSRKGA